MTQIAEVKVLVAAAVDRHGRLDVMANNTDWMQRNQPALDVSRDDFDIARLSDVNQRNSI